MVVLDFPVDETAPDVINPLLATVPGIRIPKVGTPGPIAVTARTRINCGALSRLTVNFLMLDAIVFTAVQVLPSRDVSIVYF